ncbi:MAG: aspartate kinase [Acidobacteria bacterium]|nr:MAG: aspartate kinase [Acidobacteriota bacterium]
MIVMKFGGTSVDGAEGLARAAGIVAEHRDSQPVVVTSAMAGVTDALVRLMERARRGDLEAVTRGVDELGARHAAVARELAPGDEALAAGLDAELRRLRVALRSVRLRGELSEPDADGIMGFGELMAQRLFAAALRRAGVEAEAVDPRTVVVTDARFGAARPNPAATRDRAHRHLVPLASRGAVPVLGGFVGATPEGVPTTLGRGGSDLTATVLARAIGAREVQIWTDVDGLMTADPRLVPEARVLPRATFREAAELAGFGARVLHPEAVDPAMASGVPVRVRNTLAPDRPGTLLVGDRSGHPERPAAVACRAPVELLRLHDPDRVRDPRFLSALVRIAGRADRLPLGIAIGAGGLELLLPEGRELPVGDGSSRVERRCGLAVVALVGEALARSPELWGRVLESAASAGIERLFQGPEGVSLGMVVPREQAEDLVRRLHGRWVARPAPAGTGGA